MAIERIDPKDIARFTMEDGDYFEIRQTEDGISVRCMDGLLTIIPHSSNVADMFVSKWLKE